MGFYPSPPQSLTCGKHIMSFLPLGAQKSPPLSKSMRQQSLAHSEWWEHRAPSTCGDSPCVTSSPAGEGAGGGEAGEGSCQDSGWEKRSPEMSLPGPPHSVLLPQHSGGSSGFPLLSPGLKAVVPKGVLSWRAGTLRSHSSRSAGTR